MLVADTHRAALMERHVRHSRGVGEQLVASGVGFGTTRGDVRRELHVSMARIGGTKKLKHLAADFRQRCHGYVVTSHKAQGWTADHVVVAAERFTSKGAYVACLEAVDPASYIPRARRA
jgi:hypothetical protein